MSNRENDKICKILNSRLSLRILTQIMGPHETRIVFQIALLVRDRDLDSCHRSVPLGLQVNKLYEQSRKRIAKLHSGAQPKKLGNYLNVDLQLTKEGLKSLCVYKDQLLSYKLFIHHSTTNC